MTTYTVMHTERNGVYAWNAYTDRELAFRVTAIEDILETYTVQADNARDAVCVAKVSKAN